MEILEGQAGTKAGRDRWDLAFWGLMAVAFLLCLAIFRDYAYNWDEVWGGRWYGRAVLNFFRTFGKDTASIDRAGFNLYGTLFDLPAELLAAFGPFSPRNARHLLVMLCGLAGVWGARQSARRLGGSAAGFFTALFLLTNPLWFGHQFFNYKDIPFAAAFSWALYALIAAMEELPRVSRRRMIGLGVALGALLAVRPGGVFFVAIVLFAVALDAISASGGPRERARRFLATSVSLAPALPIAYAAMIAFWPYGLTHPFKAPYEAIVFSSRIGWNFPIFWNGAFFRPVDLPWTYVPLLVLVKLPPAFLAVAAAAVLWAAWKSWNALRSGDRKLALALPVTLLAAFLTPVAAVASGATLYDNLRHFLFALCPLAVLAGLFFGVLSDAAARRLPAARLLMAAALVAALLPTVVAATRLHPYEYVYINEFGGGMPEGEGRFETDYWALSYGEAAKMILADAERVARAEGVPFAERGFTVVASCVHENLREELPPNFFVIGLKESGELEGMESYVDYYVGTTRYHTHLKGADWPVVGTVGRVGMTFAVVKASPFSAVARLPR